MTRGTAHGFRGGLPSPRPAVVLPPPIPNLLPPPLQERNMVREAISERSPEDLCAAPPNLQVYTSNGKSMLYMPIKNRVQGKWINDYN